MPVLYAELQIAGRQVTCDQVSYSFAQATDEKGRPSSVVRTGFLKVVISGVAVGWSIWEEIKFNPYRRESGHVIFFEQEGVTATRYTFYDAALVELKFLYDGTGTAGKQAAVGIELHFSAATIEIHGIRFENHSLIPWPTSPATSFKALTRPADPLPSTQLAAGPGLAMAVLKVGGEIAKRVSPQVVIPFAARVITLLPGLLLSPANSEDEPANKREWEMYHRNHPNPIPPPPPPDTVRLAQLERALDAQTLTAQEEAELIILLAKVKGIFVNQLTDLKRAVPNSATHQLLPGECRVGSFKALDRLRVKGDDITPHHIPSDAFMKKHGVSRNDGISIYMEQPETGGRHRKTKTYGGHMTPIQREAYYKMSPTEALNHDIDDARKVYRDQDLLTSQVEDALQEVIRQNKAAFPHLFK